MSEDKKRTLAQNRALHKMFELLAEELNSQGLDMRKTLKPSIDIWWNKENLKDYLWRPIQKGVTTKESSAELTSQEIDKTFEQLAYHLGQKFGIEIEFPSIETVIKQLLEEKKYNHE